MKKLLVIAALCLFSIAAQAQTFVFHFHTAHFNRSIPNDITPGFGIKFADMNESGFIVGTYTNSYFKRSNYVAYSYETNNWGVAVGVVNGYKNLKSVNGYIPMVIPSYALKTELGNMRLSLPNLQGLHVSLEF